MTNAKFSFGHIRDSLTADLPSMPAAGRLGRLMDPGRRSIVLMVVFVALWALIESLATGLSRPYSPYQVVWTRYVVHLLILAGCFWRHPGRLWRTKRPSYQLRRATLMVGMPTGWILAQQTGVPPAAILSVFWLSPLFIIAGAAALLDEWPPRWLWLVTALASAATVAPFVGGLSLRPGAILFSLGSTLCFSLYIPMTRSLRSESTPANLFYTAFGVTLVLSPFVLRIWTTPNGHDWILMVMIGGLGLLALWALDHMAALAPVSIAAPAACLQIVWASGLEALRTHAAVTTTTMLALTVVVACTLFVWVVDPTLAGDAA